MPKKFSVLVCVLPWLIPLSLATDKAPKVLLLTFQDIPCTFFLNRTQKDSFLMTRIIADSSSLILLAKCGLIETVCMLFDVVVPSAVVREVVSENLVEKYPDAATISELISKKSITVKDTGNDELPIPISIHSGEKEALILAMRLKGAVLATDDGKAIKAARFLKVPFIITPKIVTEYLKIF